MDLCVISYQYSLHFLKDTKVFFQLQPWLHADFYLNII